MSRPRIPSPDELARLPRNGGPHWNRLVFEHSPYLLQHAANPVDWHPWGDEAFERARREDKPVFLSVGYSTCHWCHVMEHESFEDAEVAQLLNETFVCIKVDREERPDIDNVYMTVTQALTGSGGWPMTVVMTPDKEAFFAGTYFPKGGRHGRAGMMELVPALGEAWRTNRGQVLESAGKITGALAQMAQGSPGGDLGVAELDRAFAELEERYDTDHGGFGHAPKFPVPHNLSFLLRYAQRTGNKGALEMAAHTLRAMRAGGVFDQVGLGLHRYSTDERWLVPHFEKMLYDQALFAIACLDAHQATGAADFADWARDIFAYVARKLTSPEGGLYSAEDADSEGEEGRCYLWTPAQVEEVLGAGDAKLFCRVYGISPEGNFFDESTGRRSGASIPYLFRSIADQARTLGMDEARLREQLASARVKLLATREERVQPGLDDKILTDWNGLMVAALARGAAVLGDAALRRAAERAGDFILATLRLPDGRLLKRARGGVAGLPAHLEDYAFAAWGFTELYEATLATRWLAAAIELTETMLARFGDAARGGCFLTADDGEKLLVRSKDIYDGAIPAGNSVGALNLLRLARLTGRSDFEAAAAGTMRAFAGAVARGPSNHTMLMQAVDFASGPTMEIVLAGDVDSGEGAAMLAEVRRRFLPRAVLLHRPAGDDAALGDVAPFARVLVPLDGRATAYVCRDFACERPVSSAAELARLLDSVSVPR